MKIKFFTIIFLFFLHSLNAAEHVVSFIIPCYNCALTVEESIDSIYQQNLKIPFEVICTDDGSPDNTLAILQQCQNKYQNLFVYVHETNKGGGAARNTCVSHSQGDLIFCLDSDNVLCPQSVVQLIDLIDTTGCDVAFFEEGKAFRGNYSYVKSFNFSVPNNTYDIYTWIDNIGKNPGYNGNYLFTRKSYDRAGGYPEDVGAADTHGFGIAQLATGSIMKTIPGTFYWHRLDDNSYYMREERHNSNTHNHCKVLKSFYEIFSKETQKILDNKNTDEIWNAFFFENKFKLASSKILRSLCNAYYYKYEKSYAEAAGEFVNAIAHGCNSHKIHHCIEEMLNLAKSQLSVN